MAWNPGPHGILEDCLLYMTGGLLKKGPSLKEFFLEFHGSTNCRIAILYLLLSTNDGDDWIQDATYSIVYQ